MMMTMTTMMMVAMIGLMFVCDLSRLFAVDWRSRSDRNCSCTARLVLRYNLVLQTGYTLLLIFYLLLFHALRPT